MPNLRGVSPVDRDDRGRSHEARTVNSGGPSRWRRGDGGTGVRGTTFR